MTFIKEYFGRQIVPALILEKNLHNHCDRFKLPLGVGWATAVLKSAAHRLKVCGGAGRRKVRAPQGRVPDNVWAA